MNDRAGLCFDDLHGQPVDPLKRVGVEQGVRIALKRHAPGIQRDNMIAKAHRHIHVMQHHHGRKRTGVDRFTQQPQHVDLMGHIQRRNRFIQQQATRPLRQHHRYPRPLFFPARHGVDHLAALVL